MFLIIRQSQSIIYISGGNSTRPTMGTKFSNDTTKYPNNGNSNADGKKIETQTICRYQTTITTIPNSFLLAIQTDPEQNAEQVNEIRFEDLRDMKAETLNVRKDPLEEFFIMVI